MGVEIEELGSVRVDLLGGTIDLWPINLILKNTVTLNLATNLKARVVVKKLEQTKNTTCLKIVSKDYDSIKEWTKEKLSKELVSDGGFHEWNFVLQIIDYFSLLHSGLLIELESGSPPGAGLGGSSAMGITLYKALSRFENKVYKNEEALQIVSSIEARILNCGPTGHQDYYPALYGGILALHSEVSGVKVEQLFCEELKSIIKKRVTLVYTGEKRLSGINNWEVYKRFFDGDQIVIQGLKTISEFSHLAYQNIKQKKYDDFIELISKEGAVRRVLFSGIMTPSMDQLFENLKNNFHEIGIKVCGAGGGGCFLLIHKEADRIKIAEEVNKTSMKILDFDIDRPNL